jgi:hypothetical protein
VAKENDGRVNIPIRLVDLSGLKVEDVLMEPYYESFCGYILKDVSSPAMDSSRVRTDKLANGLICRIKDTVDIMALEPFLSGLTDVFICISLPVFQISDQSS